MLSYKLLDIGYSRSRRKREWSDQGRVVAFTYFIYVLCILEPCVVSVRLKPLDIGQRCPRCIIIPAVYIRSLPIGKAPSWVGAIMRFVLGKLAFLSDRSLLLIPLSDSQPGVLANPAS